MRQCLQQHDDPTKKSSGTDERRAYQRMYHESCRATLGPAPNECTEATHGVDRDPDFTSLEVANICNTALSFEGTQAQIRDIDDVLVKIDRLKAMFHVALCQTDHKMGQYSNRKRKNEDYFNGEMFGASTGRIVARGDGSRYAQVVRCDGTFIHTRQEWDEAVGGHRKPVYISNNHNNCR